VEQVLPESRRVGVWWGVGTMYTHVSKYKNDKIKRQKSKYKPKKEKKMYH
jgi:hypothetical protein